MKIYLNELSDIETELEFTQAETWVSDAVARVDEKLDEITPPKPNTPPRPVELRLTAMKVDDVVVVNGNIDTYVQLVCSRCATSFHFHTRPNFSALFCKDPEMAGVGHLKMQTKGPAKGEFKPSGHTKGHARHAHDDNHDTSTSGDLDITYLSDDFIELGDVLTEQLQLQVPFQPLCKETCKGMCTQCGADLNQGRCACAKITKNTAFSVLQNLKL
jgi:uncharacterized protein